MKTATNRDVESMTDVQMAITGASTVTDPVSSLLLRKKTKILFLAANDPRAPLQLDEEYRTIDHAVARRHEKLELVAKLAVRRDELQQGLLQHMPDVVHFAGHGTRAGDLMFQGEPGECSEVSTAAFRSLLKILHDNVRLVVLNACFSARQAAAICDSVGVAIGMRRPISDRAAIAFSATFYEALAYGRSVRQAFQLGRAAIKVQGIAGEASIPRLLVRRGLDASAVRLIATSDTEIQPEAGSHVAARMLQLTLAGAFLASVIFAALFGARVLYQNIISEYVVFVVLGGLAATFTWGFLSIAPGVTGTRHSLATRLAGSTGTLAVVIAGGMWLAMSEGEFTIKIKFVNEARQPVAVTGIARLEIGGYTSSLPVNSADLLDFDQLPRRMAGRDASLTLESPAFRLDSPLHTYRVQPDGMLTVAVQPISATKLSGTVSFAAARMPGGQVSIVGRDCAGNIRDGYFEISCAGATIPAKVQVRVPENYIDHICNREFVLNALENNELVLERCRPVQPNQRPSPSPSPAPPRLCLHTPEQLIGREALLVKQHDLPHILALFAPGAQVVDAHTGKSQSPRERYGAEFAEHDFVGASHSAIRHVNTMDGKEYYTSSSAGWFIDGSGYNNPGPSDHWVLVRLGECWQIASLNINAANDGDKRFVSME